MKTETDHDGARQNAARKRGGHHPDPVVWDEDDWDRAIDGLKAMFNRLERNP